MQRYMKYITPYWAYCLLAPLCMFIEVYCDLQIPLFSAKIINQGIENLDSTATITIMLTMMLYIVCAVSSGIGAAYFASKASVNFACDLREDVFTKIQDFSFSNIDKFTAGSLITRLTNDISQLQQLVMMVLRMLIRVVGMLVGAVIMAYTINKEVSVIFTILLPILTIIVYAVLKLSFSKFMFLQEKVDDLNIRVREVLVNIRVIKAFTREDYEEDKFKTVNENLTDTSLKAYRISLWQTPLITLSVNMATIGVLYMGGQLLEINELQIGDISALITYLTQILASVNMLGMVFLQSTKSIVSARRLGEVLDTNIDITDNESDKVVGSGDIRFENVSFKYTKNNNEMVLRNLNLEIKSGETVGIIGSTGCGKTSFAHLIPRLYDANEGNVYVDGTNVKDYTLHNLREGVAVVLQNNILFTGTIKENLLWGNTNATQDEIEKVADWSAAKEFITNFDNKYDTKIEQSGVNLSGGQKQRLCIARALLKRPKIIILDDSTSAVDTATERKINKHLYEELNDTTKIIIAQRITSVIDASKIIVMDKGIVEAIGTHEELLNSSLTYQEIYNSQMERKAANV
ncbi:MAG: ABC transporter [Epulopiscium sp. Nele67-Bin005]|nr:MAG: ABC transporter [Epulopiscium sp. Nele67-Bin005]